MGDNGAIIALIAAIFGGGGVKIVEYILNRGRVRADEATQIRQELREEAELRRAEVRRLEKELDEWKARYYELLSDFNTMKAEFEGFKIMARAAGFLPPEVTSEMPVQTSDDAE